MRRRLAIMLATAVVLATASPALAGGTLQPGAYHETDVGACTLNFVFDGTGAQAGKVFIATAAHCVEGVGDEVRDFDGEPFGRVGAVGDADDTKTDWALIEVFASERGRVSPSVAGHPSYPTGYTTPAQTAFGDQIQFSGYGLGFNLLRPTRERRFGLLTFDDAEIWRVAGPMNFGDSGGPLVHVRTGRALGVESRVCLGVCTDEGPTVQGVIAKAGKKGFTVTLRTAGN